MLVHDQRIDFDRRLTASYADANLTISCRPRTYADTSRKEVGGGAPPDYKWDTRPGND